METSSSILIILVFSSVFSQIFLSITFSSFPSLSLSLFPREPRVSSSSSFSSSFQPYHVHFNLLLARSFAPRTQRKIFVPPRLHFQLPSPPTFHHSPPFQQGSNVPRVSFSCSLRPCSFRHRRCPASALFQIRGGRGEKWSSGSRRGKKRDRKHGNDPRVYVCVCARVEGKTCRSRINMPFEPSSTHASRWMKVHQSFIDPRNRRGKKTVCSKVGITIVAGERDKERERGRERGRFP